ncbi:MAG: electron transfer flavoprotein subunit beta/FixA family protein [Candidatus Heimdallarchaeota archaeon]|nr:electron transfer flavoprotein subunit beta/FixA family protein [Candidatus Heimdallarchaeota archaeon]
MKIVSLLKSVPDTETKFQINADGSDVEDDGTIEYIIGPYDEYAVEEAIKIKEKLGGEVISVTIGKGIEEKSIRKAMAMGVDSGILIESKELYGSDPLSIAKALKAVIEPIGADIILCGKIATDSSDSFIGPALAALLNIPVITEISSLEVTESGIVATRDASGRKEKFESGFPVLLTADKGLNEPRYPKLPMIMKAKKKPLDKKDSAGTEIRNFLTQVKVELPPTKGAGTKMTGTADELVSELVDGLVNKEKII